MEKFNEIVGTIAGLIWGPWLIITLVGIGVYFTLGTGFLQIRKFPYIFKQTFGRIFQKESDIVGEGTLTPRQAAFTALSSTIGVGNIVGVATAIVLGGPGAVFWMWVSAFFGMMTKYAEIVLSIHFREKDSEGNFVGGPAWYMRKGLKSPLLAILFSAGLALACLGGNMVQANAVSGTVQEFFGLSPVVVGIVLVILVAVVTLGGIRRLGKITESLVPIMAVIFMLGGIIVLLFNITGIPEAFRQIFVGAFTPVSAAGGVAGFAVMEAIRYGIARGLYSNEAGQGTAPIAHATAKTDHPVRQGFWGVMEVFTVTFVICTITALTILTTGVLATETSASVITSVAFGTVFPAFKYIIGISLILFAFSTIITLSYYGETLTRSVVGDRVGKWYRYVFLPFTFIGAIGGLQTIWGLVDVLIGVAVIPNLLALLLLSPIVFRLTKEFFADPAKVHLYDKK